MVNTRIYVLSNGIVEILSDTNMLINTKYIAKVSHPGNAYLFMDLAGHTEQGTIAIKFSTVGGAKEGYDILLGAMCDKPNE